MASLQPAWEVIKDLPAKISQVIILHASLFGERSYRGKKSLQLVVNLCINAID